MTTKAKPRGMSWWMPCWLLVLCLVVAVGYCDENEEERKPYREACAAALAPVGEGATGCLPCRIAQLSTDTTLSGIGNCPGTVDLSQPDVLKAVTDHHGRNAWYAWITDSSGRAGFERGVSLLKGEKWMTDEKLRGGRWYKPHHTRLMCCNDTAAPDSCWYTLFEEFAGNAVSMAVNETFAGAAAGGKRAFCMSWAFRRLYIDVVAELNQYTFPEVPPTGVVFASGLHQVACQYSTTFPRPPSYASQLQFLRQYLQQVAQALQPAPRWVFHDTTYAHSWLFFKPYNTPITNERIDEVNEALWKEVGGVKKKGKGHKRWPGAPVVPLNELTKCNEGMNTTGDGIHYNDWFDAIAIQLDFTFLKHSELQGFCDRRERFLPVRQSRL